MEAGMVANSANAPVPKPTTWSSMSMPCDVVAHGDHPSGDVGAEHRVLGAGEAVAHEPGEVGPAPHLECVAAVDAGCLDLDQYVAGRNGGAIDVAEGQAVGGSEAVPGDGFHRGLRSVMRSREDVLVVRSAGRHAVAPTRRSGFGRSVTCMESAVGQLFEAAAPGEEPQGEPDLGNQGWCEDDRRCRPVVAGDQEEAERVDQVAGAGQHEEHAERTGHLVGGERHVADDECADAEERQTEDVAVLVGVEVQQRQRVGLAGAEGVEVVGVVEDAHGLEHVEQVQADDRGLGHAERCGEQRQCSADGLEQLVEDDRDGDIGDEHDDVGGQPSPEQHRRIDDVACRGGRVARLDESGADTDLGEEAAGDDDHVEDARGTGCGEPSARRGGCGRFGVLGRGLGVHVGVSVSVCCVGCLVVRIGVDAFSSRR